MKTRNPRKYNVSGNTKLFMNCLILRMERLINKLIAEIEKKAKLVLYR